MKNHPLAHPNNKKQPSRSKVAAVRVIHSMIFFSNRQPLRHLSTVDKFLNPKSAHLRYPQPIVPKKVVFSYGSFENLDKKLSHVRYAHKKTQYRTGTGSSFAELSRSSFCSDHDISIGFLPFAKRDYILPFLQKGVNYFTFSS